MNLYADIRTAAGMTGTASSTSPTAKPARPVTGVFAGTAAAS
jgi:hypothetical protein